MITLCLLSFIMFDDDSVDVLTILDDFSFHDVRVNPAALSKILTSDKTLLQATNELLISKVTINFLYC